MYLKEIELVGFKSFARPAKLSFKAPITAIVGPNGSGKSNIAEAMRFVLGEQSMKSLRSKRGEDLIFNGSKNIPRLNRASVSITFDNSKKNFDIDYNEVEIKRVVFRDATNHYYINSKKVRLKDVVELLSSANIGTSSHHIISQGESDRILNAGIKERREMIEDALGLRIYHFKKKESDRKLKKTQDNIQKVVSLRREIGPHLRFLERQVKGVERVEKLKIELKDIYKKYLGMEDAYIKNQKSKLTNKKTSPEKNLKEINQDIEKKELALKTLDKGSEKNKDILGFEKLLRDVRDSKDSLGRELGRLEGMLEYAKSRPILEIENKKILGDISTLLSIPKKKFRELFIEIEGFLSSIDASDDIFFIKKTIIKIKESTSFFYNKYYIKEETFPGNNKEPVVDEYDDIKDKKDNVEKKLGDIKKKEEEVSFLLYEVKEKIEKDRSVERKLEKEFYELRSKRTELLTQLELIKVQEERLDEDESYFNQEKIEATHFIGSSGYTLNDEESTEFLKKDSKDIRADQEKNRRSIEKIKAKIEELGGEGGDILKEYKDVKERDEYLQKETSDLEKSIETLDNLIKELGEKIDTEFRSGVEKINVQFQKLFETMFDGGIAKIKTVLPPKKIKKKDNDDILGEINLEEDENMEEGLDIIVELPQKRLRGLHMLSGGERSLTSIALIFAVAMVNPPPFLVLDETDAALDESNARKYGALIEKLTNHTQFIIITHARETMIRAHVLYGVTSTDGGVSRLLSIKLGEYSKEIL